jgi:hypothetical protein
MLRFWASGATRVTAAIATAPMKTPRATVFAGSRRATPTIHGTEARDWGWSRARGPGALSWGILAGSATTATAVCSVSVRQ